MLLEGGETRERWSVGRSLQVTKECSLEGCFFSFLLDLILAMGLDVLLHLDVAGMLQDANWQSQLTTAWNPYTMSQSTLFCFREDRLRHLLWWEADQHNLNGGKALEAFLLPFMLHFLSILHQILLLFFLLI